MTALSQAIEESLSRLNNSIGDHAELTVERIEELKNLQNQILDLKNKKNKFENCSYNASFNKEYFEILKQVLKTYKELIIPILISREMGKLKAIASMSEAAQK